MSNDTRRMALRCRLGWHGWHIWCVSMAGRDSYRERRCGRCLKRGHVTIDRQETGYFGKHRGPWTAQERYAVPASQEHALGDDR